MPAATSEILMRRDDSGPRCDR